MSPAFEAENLKFELADGIATITIDRVGVRNAIDRPTAAAIQAAMDELDRDPEIRVGVITGAGGFFSAGMDLKALAATGERPVVEPRGAFGITRQPPETPLIAAVEGPALGGGFEIALSCDLIVAAANARFGLPEVKRGLIAAAGGLLRLPRRLPTGLATELALTGRMIGAEEAADLHLVNRLAPDGAALDVALELAAEIAANAPLAVKASKKIAAFAVDQSVAAGFDLQAPELDVVRNSADAREGVEAYVNKRDPVWKGR